MMIFEDESRRFVHDGIILSDEDFKNEKELKDYITRTIIDVLIDDNKKAKEVLTILRDDYPHACLFSYNVLDTYEIYGDEIAKLFTKGCEKDIKKFMQLLLAFFQERFLLILLGKT